MLTEFLLHQFHGSEDRSFGTASAKTCRPRRHNLGESLDFRIAKNRARVWNRRLVSEQRTVIHLDEGFDSFHHDRCRVLAAKWQHVLAGDLRLDVATAQQRMEGLLDVLRSPLL